MSEIFSKILASQGYILADGATGTNLFNVGLESGEAPEIWNNNFPEKIKDLYRQSVLAGSDLFLTNSFGGNASRLALHGASDMAYELSKLSALLGLEVALVGGGLFWSLFECPQQPQQHRHQR